MEYIVNVTSVAGTPLLVVRRRATLAQLVRVVPEACGTVWDFIRRSHTASHGRNVAVYLNEHIDREIDLEVGVEVDANTAGGDEVMLSATPAGTVATTTHLGPYSRLPEAHEAVRRWCSANRHRLAGPNWEVYDHWTNDVEQLRTDVFYLLTPDA